MLKLAKVIKCRKTLDLLSTITGTRQFHVVLGGTTSKTRRIKNGVPQGSVLAPILFNIYIRDLPETSSMKLGYADDWVLAHQSKHWEDLERVLSSDMNKMKDDFDRWYLEAQHEQNRLDRLPPGQPHGAQRPKGQGGRHHTAARQKSQISRSDPRP